jgi:LPS O-antigen subunit length determinant protein (WzzB/FepE family)
VTENKIADETNVDEIDLTSIFVVAWKRRKLIGFGTLLTTLLVIGICLLLPHNYRSEGFYQFGNPQKKIVEIEGYLPINSLGKFSDKVEKKVPAIGIPLPLYKSISTQFFNPNRLQYVASQDKFLNKNEYKEIEHNFSSPTDINKWFKPVYAFAKEDAREFLQLSPDESNRVIGLNLIYETDSPKRAHDYVSFFGRYIRDCLLYVTSYNFIMDGYSTTQSELNKNENEIIGLEFEISQNTKKMQDIRAILSNYPESAKIENRQLVSIQDGGSRFLAPVTQLVGIESSLADLRLYLADLKREREKLNIRSAYFLLCLNELPKIGENGGSLFAMLKSKKEEVFSDKDLGQDSVKAVFNSLSIDLQTFDFTYFKNSRFISGPTVPSVAVGPRRIFIVILSAFVSFIFFTTLSFALFRWQGNKKSILSGRR